MRILIIRRGGVGDIVVTLPTLEILRNNYPNAYIEAIGSPERWEIAYKRYYLDAISSGENKLAPELYNEASTIKEVREPHSNDDLRGYFSSFDLILAYIHDPDGIVTKNLRTTGAKLVITQAPFLKGEDIHAVEYTASPLKNLELSVEKPLVPKIYLLKKDLEFAEDFLLPYQGFHPLIAIHPRSFGERGWQLDKFIQIGKFIEGELGGKVIWILGPAEEGNLKAIKSNFPASPLLWMQSLPKVAAVLKSCDLYIGCDCGITHVAAAAGAKVVAMFGPTNPRVWGPRGDRVFIIEEDMIRIEEERVKKIIEKSTDEETD